jgi:putative transposase
MRSTPATRTHLGKACRAPIHPDRVCGPITDADAEVAVWVASHMLKAIHAQESRTAADQKARAIIEDLRASKMTKAADLVEQSVHETLTYYTFPDIHWQKIRTNNPLERIMREIRRRTRVVGAFPDGQSCLNLAAARLRYIAGTAWSTKRYMNMRPLYQPQVMQTGAVA